MQKAHSSVCHTLYTENHRRLHLITLGCAIYFCFTLTIISKDIIVSSFIQYTDIGPTHYQAQKGRWCVLTSPTALHRWVRVITA